MNEILQPVEIPWWCNNLYVVDDGQVPLRMQKRQWLDGSEDGKASVQFWMLIMN